MSFDNRIKQYCAVDPMDFFSLPPKEAPAELPKSEITIYPPFAEFIDFGGASKHMITNTGGQRLVFKVKCSNNMLFKVNPVYSFISPGASVELQILRHEGPPRNDKLVVMYKECKKGERDARKLFENGMVEGKKVLPLITRETESGEHS